MTFDKKVCPGYISRMSSNVSPEQVRAARGWLGWTQQVLAKRAHVGLSTIKDFEGGSRTPILNNLSAIRQALEGAGIELIFDPEGKPKGVHANGHSR
jgi:transcriptional regulator with XRE-family HTH domain